MNKFLLLGFLLGLPSLASAQEVTIAWDGSLLADNYHIWAGPSETALAKIKTVTAGVLEYKVTPGVVVCYGVSASNEFGESDVATKTDDGKSVCLGKPNRPGKFRFSVAAQ